MDIIATDNLTGREYDAWTTEEEKHSALVIVVDGPYGCEIAIDRDSLLDAFDQGCFRGNRNVYN